MKPSAPTQAFQRAAPLALWREAEAMLGALFALFGSPALIALTQMMEAGLYRQALAWLSAAEALLRRLILIEAAALDVGRALLRSKSARPKPRLRRMIAHDPEAPEDWRVTLRLTEPSARRGTANWRRFRRLPKRVFSAWAVAERFEAVVRAFNDPAPLAKRLALRMKRARSNAAMFSRWPKAAQVALDRELMCALDARCAALGFDTG